MKKSIAATLLPIVLASSLGIAGASMRRRAVRFPGPPATPTHVLAVKADTTVYLTNHGVKPSTLKACYVPQSYSGNTSGCIENTLQPGNTASYPAMASATFGKLEPGLVTITSGEPLEVRGDQDGYAVNDLLGNADHGFVLANNPSGTQHNLTLYTVESQVTVLEKLLDEYGAIIGQTRTTLNPYTIKTQNLSDVFGRPILSPIVQVEITPETGTHLGAYLTSNDVVFSAVPEQKTKTDAFIPRVNGTTVVTQKNMSRSNTAIQQTYFFPENQDNSTTITRYDTILTPYSASTTPDVLAKEGQTGKTGSIRVSNPEQPVLAFATHGNNSQGLTLADAALAKSGSFNNQNEQVIDLDIAGLDAQAKITNWNISHNPNNINPLTITGRLDVYRADGTTAGTKAFTLRQDENQTYTLGDIVGNISNARVQMHLNNDPNTGLNISPQALMIAEDNGIIRKGYRVAPAITKVTGEEYVKKWLDPLLVNYFYINKAELTDLLHSAQGDTLLGYMYQASTYPGTLEAYTNIYTGWADGNPQNGELCQSRDPGYIDLRDNGGDVGIELAPNCARSNNKLRNEDLPATRILIRTFFNARTETKPTEYGGSITSGPNLSYNPTWTTQDPTP